MAKSNLTSQLEVSCHDFITHVFFIYFRYVRLTLYCVLFRFNIHRRCTRSMLNANSAFLKVLFGFSPYLCMVITLHKFLNVLARVLLISRLIKAAVDSFQATEICYICSNEKICGFHVTSPPANGLTWDILVMRVIY